MMLECTPFPSSLSTLLYPCCFLLSSFVNVIMMMMMIGYQNKKNPVGMCVRVCVNVEGTIVLHVCVCVCAFVRVRMHVE